MNNDDAQVGTIFSRRDALVMAAKAGFGLTAAGLFSTSLGQQSQKINLIASPALTEGPFFVDKMLNRSDLLSGTTREAVLLGKPLDLEFAVLKMTGSKSSPLVGCQVDVWHCDTKGVYSDEDTPMNHEKTGGQTWLRGYQITDSRGNASFKTIVPGWYPGRTAHVHFKVRSYSDKHQLTAEFTSQLFFHESELRPIYANPPYSGQDVPDLTNLRDNIFSQRQVDGSIAGDHLLLDMKLVQNRYKARFAIVLGDKTFKSHDTGRSRGLESWDQF